MKKYIPIIFTVLSVLTISCQKNEVSSVDDNNFVIIADISSNSKVTTSSSSDETGVKMKWTTNDKIIGYWLDNKTKTSVEFKVKTISGEGTYAIFEKDKGTLPETDAEFFLVCVPSTVASPSDWNSGLDIDMSVQNISNISDISNYSYLCASGRSVDKQLSLHFSNQFSVLKITAFEELPSGTDQLILSATNLYSKGKIKYDGNYFGFHAVAETSSITIPYDNSSAKPVYFVIPIGTDNLLVNDITLTANKTTGSDLTSKSKSLGTTKNLSRSTYYVKSLFSFSNFSWLEEHNYNGHLCQFAIGNLQYDGNEYIMRQSQYEYGQNANMDYFVYDDLPENIKLYILTYEQMLSLFDTVNKDNYGYGQVDNKNGIIIIPESFNDPKLNSNIVGENRVKYEYFVSKGMDTWDYNKWSKFLEENKEFIPKKYHSDLYTANIYSSSGWKLMENNGAIFLPSAGNSGLNSSNIGYYVINTENGNNNSFYFTVSIIQKGSALSYKYSVRMVKNYRDAN